MWKRIHKAIKSYDPIRIENRCEKGTPDVNISTGAWIELKWQRKAPKRNIVLKLDHDMTLEQRIWAIRRHRAGGKSYVLLKIAQEWLLFEGYIAAELLGKVSLEELRGAAIKVWNKKLNDCELQAILTRN